MVYLFKQYLRNRQTKYQYALAYWQGVCCHLVWKVGLVLLLQVFQQFPVTAQSNVAQQYRFQGKLTPAQQEAEKALLTRLERARDTVRVEILDSIAWVYRGTDFGRAMYYAQQAAQEVARLGFPRVRAENNNYIGIIHRNLGNYPKAMQSFDEARRIAEQYGYRRELGYALNNIGEIYRFQEKYAEARDYVFRAQKIFLQLRDTSGLYYSAIRLGEIALSLQSYPQGLAYFQEAERYSLLTHNKVWEAGVLNRLGQVLRLQKQYQSALEVFLRALAIARTLEHDEDEQSHILIEIGKTHIAVGSTDSATLYLKQGLAIAEAIGIKQRVLESSKNLAEIFTRQRSYEEALRYRTLQMTMKDSLFSELGRREIEKISARYELEKQQNDIAALSAAQKQERIISTGLVIGVMLLLAVALLLYRNVRAEQRANQEIMRQQEVLEHQALEIETTNTTLQEQNEELAALNTEKTELMNIVAHDLKNPIGAIHGLADLITSGMVQEKQVQETAEHIAMTAERMLRLVTNVLDSSKFEAGMTQLEAVEFDIIPVIELTCSQYQAAAEAKGISLHVESHGESALALANEQALIQVADNIISNAVKYSPQGKKVWVRIWSKNEEYSPMLNGDSFNNQMTNDQKTNGNVVRIEVVDEGPGISEEDMKKLFGKFARLSARPTGGEHSTGLGLNIVKMLVELMNGRVWCESKLGYGATFIVELPTNVS